MDKTLQDRIEEIDREIDEVNDILVSEIGADNEFSRRITFLADDLEELYNILNNEDNPPEIIEQLENDIQTFIHTIDRYSDIVSSAEIEASKARSRLEELVKAKSFVELTTDPSFQAKNSATVDKVFSDSNLTRHISGYLGGKSKRTNKKKHKRRKTRKHKKN